MRKLKKFGLGINGKTTEKNGHVSMTHEETYSISLVNEHGRRADVELLVDGESVGAWRMEAFQRFSIERPADKARKFTFVKKDSEEGKLLGGKESELGVITATFKPEKEYESTTCSVESTKSTRGGPRGSSLGKSAGGTVLGEHSKQEFGTASQIDYAPESEFVTIHLRLVHQEKYTSLQSNSTDVPPPA